MRIIMGLDGTDEGKRRTEQLARNTIYFRRRLEQMGVIIIGHDNSPVVPMMVYLFSKIAYVCQTSNGFCHFLVQSRYLYSHIS